MSDRNAKQHRQHQAAQGDDNRPLLIVSLMRLFLRVIGQIFLSPVVPPIVRRNLLRVLDNNWLARQLVLRLPSRVRVGDGLFLTDVGSPSVSSRLGFWTGNHEAPERRLVRHLLPDVPILEIGAGVGVVSFAAWRAAQCPAIVVVEANPAVIEILSANLRENNVPATIVHAALAYGNESANLLVDKEWITGRVSDEITSGMQPAGFKVRANTLQGLLDEYFDPLAEVQLILDVEGGEWELLQREAETIKKRIVRVVVELHGNEGTAGLLERARRAFGEMGFGELASDAGVACYARKSPEARPAIAEDHPLPV